MLELGPVRFISPMRNLKKSVLLDFSMATMAVEKLRQRQQGLSTEKRNIFSVMIDHLKSDASDPRDKIFGFHGLAYDSSRFVTVDYSKTVVEVYQSFAQRYIQQTQTLNVVLRAGVSSPGKVPTMSLPSWVPDWRCDAQKGMLNMKTQLYSATKGAKHRIQPNYNRRVLLAQGILCDTVILFKNEASFFGLEDLLFARGPADYPTQTPRLQAIFRALVVDKYYASDTRLEYDPDPWLLRLMMGFLIDLGIKANPGSPYAKVALEGIASQLWGHPP
jgi:hypothetical protein